MKELDLSTWIALAIPAAILFGMVCLSALLFLEGEAQGNAITAVSYFFGAIIAVLGLAASHGAVPGLMDIHVGFCAELDVAIRATEGAATR